MPASNITYHPIGIFHSSQVHPYEAGRQPDDLHSEGYIELATGHNFEQALIGLEAGQRIWVIFQFHLNNHWNTMVLPPRGSSTKLGVFATRSPYRPNNIGMSCVVISKIEKLKIYVNGADILNDSPILDIKPYVGYADAFPESEPPWLKNSEKFEISFSELAKEQIDFLESLGISQLRGFLHHQLEFEPINSKKKRVSSTKNSANNLSTSGTSKILVGENNTDPNEAELAKNQFILAYRTWRVCFILNAENKSLQIKGFKSGYSTEELDSQQPNYKDTYLDKDTHRIFVAKYK